MTLRPELVRTESGRAAKRLQRGEVAGVLAGRDLASHPVEAHLGRQMIVFGALAVTCSLCLAHLGRQIQDRFPRVSNLGARRVARGVFGSSSRQGPMRNAGVSAYPLVGTHLLAPALSNSLHALLTCAAGRVRVSELRSTVTFALSRNIYGHTRCTDMRHTDVALFSQVASSTWC